MRAPPSRGERVVAVAVGEVFRSLDPRHATPIVPALARDETRRATDRACRAIGDEIAHHRPWPPGRDVEAGWRTRRRRTSAVGTAVGDAVDTPLFGPRVGGLQLG